MALRTAKDVLDQPRMYDALTDRDYREGVMERMWGGSACIVVGKLTVGWLSPIYISLGAYPTLALVPLFRLLPYFASTTTSCQRAAKTTRDSGSCE